MSDTILTDEQLAAIAAAGAVRNLLLPRIDRTWKGKD